MLKNSTPILILSILGLVLMLVFAGTHIKNQPRPDNFDRYRFGSVNGRDTENVRDMLNDIGLSDLLP